MTTITNLEARLIRDLPKQPITDPVELLRAAARIIRKYPEFHDQHDWSHSAMDLDEMLGETPNQYGPEQCGTTFCAAGWICTLGGARWATQATLSVPWSDSFWDAENIAHYLVFGPDADEFGPDDPRWDIQRKLSDLFGSINYDAYEVADRLDVFANLLERLS